MTSNEDPGSIQTPTPPLSDPPQPGSGGKGKLALQLQQLLARTRSAFAPLRTRVSALLKKSKFAGSLQERLHERVKNVELITMAEYLTQALQKRGMAFYGRMLTLVLCTYFLADVLALTAGRFIPEPPSTRSSRGMTQGKNSKALEDYNVIASRNLFNSQGLIPGEENVGAGGPADLGGPPVKTTLPLNLLGSIILRDETRSIATIEDTQAKTVYPVRITEEIPGKAKIIEIQVDRVIFVNSSTGKREFVELPKQASAINPRVTVGGPKSPLGASIQQPNPNSFVIPRTEVERALGDLNNILTQARAVPNIENGQPAGYKLFQIVPGSIYDQLGLKNGDVIAGMDNQPVSDPGKAFEALAGLRDGSKKGLQLTIKRDGKTFTNSYDVN